MTSKRLPIVGFPHLGLAAQENNALFDKTVAALRKQGFTVQADQIVPPEGSTGPQVIAAVTAAFQAARSA